MIFKYNNSAWASRLSGLIVVGILGCPPAAAEASRLLQFHDSTDNVLAAGQIMSGNQTGWNDPTIYTGKIATKTYRILVAIKDTLKLQRFFDHCTLDSAKLSVYVSTQSGTPGDLNAYFIRRDSAGMGVYGAYDDIWSVYCRSSWRNRKGANVTACPDSIMWQTPGAEGANDYNSAPFAIVTAPAAANIYQLDVTAWIRGIVNHTDTISNGIILRAATESSGYIGIYNIWPFQSDNTRMLDLKIWVSNWDWVHVRLDSNRVDDGWIGTVNPDTIFSDSAYLKTGTGAGAPLSKFVSVIVPDDSALFGDNAIPAGSHVDSVKFYGYATNQWAAPNDTIAVGEILPPAAFTRGEFPSWDSAAAGVDWAGGTWSISDVARRASRFVNSVNTWYTWSDAGLAAMIQRWSDSSSTRHGLAIWDVGSNTNKASAWADRTAIGFNTKACSLLVWIRPPPLRRARRAWIDDPSPLK